MSSGGAGVDTETVLWREQKPPGDAGNGVAARRPGGEPAYPPPAHGINSVALISTEEIANHRGRLIQDIVATGCRVLAFAPYREDIPAAIAAAGAEFHETPMDRVALNPVTAAREVMSLAQRLRQEHVNLVFTAGTKPNLVGTLAAVRAGVPARYAMIAGLGYAYTPGKEIRRHVTRGAMSLLMRRVYRQCNALFVQNEDDLRFVREAGWCRPNQPVIRTYGSGVDLEHFRNMPLPDGPLRVLLMSRLLREKGIWEFVEAARIVRGRHPGVRFQLLGRTDTNPGSISSRELAQWQAEGIVDYLGATYDVRPYLRDCSVFVLPSYYREGVPRTILEAMATGRPIITTDTPGCRDTVVDGVNGFLIPPRDPQALATAIERLIAAPQLSATLARESRRLAEEKFDVRSVSANIIGAMGLSDARSGHCR